MNLRERVRQALATSSEPDPGIVAQTVLASLGDDEIRPALEDTLRLFVRQVISETRISRNTAAAAPLNRSRKVAAIRDWQARLNDRYHIGGGRWKLLADMTFDDLKVAAEERREMAQRNAAWAGQLEAWASLVRRCGVSTFGDLPTAEQESALGNAA